MHRLCGTSLMICWVKLKVSPLSCPELFQKRTSLPASEAARSWRRLFSLCVCGREGVLRARGAEEKERKREKEGERVWVWREGACVGEGVWECVCMCIARERVCEVCAYIMLGFNALHIHIIIHVHVSLTDTIIQLTLYQLMYMYVLD